MFNLLQERDGMNDRCESDDVTVYFDWREWSGVSQELQISGCILSFCKLALGIINLDNPVAVRLVIGRRGPERRFANHLLHSKVHFSFLLATILRVTPIRATSTRIQILHNLLFNVTDPTPRYYHIYILIIQSCLINVKQTRNRCFGHSNGFKLSTTMSVHVDEKIRHIEWTILTR